MTSVQSGTIACEVLRYFVQFAVSTAVASLDFFALVDAQGGYGASR